DPDSGTLKWHYQFTPHDTHDWDANEIPVLADLAIGGRDRKVVLLANRNGFFYVLDRATGEVLLGKPFANTTWAKEIGKDGRPILIPGHDPTPEGTETCPDWYGSTNFMSPSYDPANKLFFVTVRETCARFLLRPPPANVNIGDRTMGGTVAPVVGHKSWGALRAIDPATAEQKWQIRYEGAGWAGVLATSGGVVFSGDHEGNFFAAASRPGRNLSTYRTGIPSLPPRPPFARGARQYVFIGSGAALTAFALPRKPTS